MKASMTEQRQWHLPTKRKGESKTRIQYRIDPLFTQALSEYAADQSRIQGIKISSATVIVTSVLKYNKCVADRYKQLKRENNQHESQPKTWNIKNPASVR